MSNYFQLIQEISKIKLGKQPSLFSEISSNKYNKIKEAIKNASEDIYFTNSYDFRKLKTTLSTVIDQECYKNNYGIIDSMLSTNSNDSIKKLCYNPSYEDITIMNNNSETNEPSQYTIFGEEIKLYPIPDAVYTLTIFYESDKWSKYVGAIDASCASAQAKVYVSETEGFSVGNSVTIEPNTPREEIGTIGSITTDDYLTLSANLTYTHASGAVDYYKNSFDYEDDEPNFPSKFHTIIEYKALMELYYGDNQRRAKYMQLYQNKRKQMWRESRGSKANTPYFIV